MPIHGQFSYAGIPFAIDSAEYINSQGITPGVARISVLPGPTPPATGNVVITDTTNGITTVPDCLLDNLQSQIANNSQTWHLFLHDRRWRWRFGYIDLCANQYDDSNRTLLPGSIMSAQEIAILCLTAMNETGYTIDGIPPGLTTAQRLNVVPFLPVGLRYPPDSTGGNPPINWVARNPAEALQELCDIYGCRIVYQLSTNTVAIVKAGVGNPLPPGGSIYKDSPSLKLPAPPDSFVVKGSPNEYQTRLLLVPVAKEWTGEYVPVDEVSYAPPRLASSPQKQIMWCYVVVGPNGTVEGDKFQLAIAPAGQLATTDNPNAQTFTYSTETGDDAETIVNALLTLVNSAGPGAEAHATANGDVLVLTGFQDGVGFAVGTMLTFAAHEEDEDLDFYQENKQAPFASTVSGWTACSGPVWPTVQATDRLTYDQAVALAEESVYRCYKVVNSDLTTPSAVRNKPLISVPGYPSKVWPSQLVLLNKQVEQIVPTAALPGVEKAGTVDPQVILDQYQGVAKSQPPRVYGTVSLATFLTAGYNLVVWPEQVLNTDPRDLVMVDFDLDPATQVVKFQQRVWQDNDPDGWLFPSLVLQCAVNIRNITTFALETFTFTVPYAMGVSLIGAGGKVVNVPAGPVTALNPMVEQHLDCAMAVVSQYTQPGQITVNDKYFPPNKLLSWNLLDADPIYRAAWYIQGMYQSLQLGGAQIRGYLGLLPIDCSGTIQQVSWSIGRNGCETIASLNCEHHPFVPNYPQRRFAELLPAIQGQLERNQRATLLPSPS
jgi:hypothetical protein